MLTVRSSTIIVLAFVIGIFVFDRAAALPRSTPFLLWILDVGFLAGILVISRAVHEKALTAAFAPFLTNPSKTDRTPVLLLGELNAADMFLRDIERDPTSPHRPSGIVTPHVTDLGRELRGVKVRGSLQSMNSVLEAFCAESGPRSVVFLDESIAPADIDADLLGRLRIRGIKLLRRQNTIELKEGGAKPARYREVNLEELLSRPPVQLNLEPIRDLISGRRILVTGAGGSIGSEICRQVASLGCAHIGLLDHSEFALFNIDMEIGRRFPTLSKHDILCDIRDPRRVDAWVAKEEPHVIFHAAALKHVPLMESHPCESVLTNVIGTWNIADAARKYSVEDMVFISTDKAVDPGNVMGATKRLAESVMRAHRAAISNTRFSVVRFGNVLGSAGSVVPTFMAQIERGGPVTVTHADVKRYFMTIPEAVQLVLHATATSASRNDNKSGVFVLDMGKPVRIMDLATRLIELSGKVPGRDVEIQITGLRPGEKLTEELVDTMEEAQACDLGFFEIADRTGHWIDQAAVRSLEQVAHSGDPQAARRRIFELLERVRQVEGTLIRKPA